MSFTFTPDRILQTKQRIKTQTRRPRKLNHYSVWTLDRTSGHFVITRIGSLKNNLPYRTVYAVGSHRAIRPGRTAKGVGFIEITDIRSEDVRNISEEDVIAEGFLDKADFLMVWAGFYDLKAVRAFGKMDTTSALDFYGLLKSRPDDLYDAWAITYKYLGEAPVVPDLP